MKNHWMPEFAARFRRHEDELKWLYCELYHNRKEYKRGDHISYGGRFYDRAEMENLVDSSLEFWLTAGRYVQEFEKDFAAWLGVKFVSTVNSGSSANLLAFMALTSPLLKERAIAPGMRSSPWLQASPPPWHPYCSMEPCRCSLM